jgi:hypothetical protein
MREAKPPVQNAHLNILIKLLGSEQNVERAPYRSPRRKAGMSAHRPHVQRPENSNPQMVGAIIGNLAQVRYRRDFV